MLSYNLHTMGGIYKEGWIWDFLINFSFWWLQNLTSGTFGCMIEHSSHCAVIVSDNEINYKEAITECIIYQLYNCRRIHNFWASLKVFWALMFFWFFSYLFCSITLPEGLGIEYHSKNPLAYATNDERIPLEESYLLPDDLFCQPISYVTVSLTFFLFFSCLIEHTSRNITDCCVLVCLLFNPEEPLQLPNLSPAVLPCLHMIQFL